MAFFNIIKHNTIVFSFRVCFGLLISYKKNTLKEGKAHDDTF